MLIKESLEKLNSDLKFKEYKKNYPDAYLSHFFMMMDNDIKQDWQIGYYDKDSNLVSTFTVTSKEIIAQEPQAPFNKPGDVVARLNFEDVVIEYDKAMQTSKSCLKENYPKALTNKTMVVLQNIKTVGEVWNITFITLNLDTINIRINVNDGNVISHEKQSLIQDIKPGKK